MEEGLEKIINGYQLFREKYVGDDQSVLKYLSYYGQKPKIMVIACCDSRVDPALILQCDPGDLFVVRNVANIVPPYLKDEAHHGTSAALEFGIKFLNVRHLILLGHSQCGGIEALFSDDPSQANDFISHWVTLVKCSQFSKQQEVDDYAKIALLTSRANCMTFPWIEEKVEEKKLSLHLWFFDIRSGQIFTYVDSHQKYVPLETAQLFESDLS
jgi:carbonic anhydrase